MPFDPDKYLGNTGSTATFDPDAYLRKNTFPDLKELGQKEYESRLRLREARDKFEEELATPDYRIGLKKPFSDDMLVSAPIPEELGSFIEGARRSIIPTGAGAAAASAVTPLARTAGAALRAAPGPARLAAPVVELGLPLAAGAVGAIGTGLAQEELLPQIDPELVARNPTSNLVGQFAGMGPFFRPGLPIGSEGRLATPLLSGAIGGGIEGAQQIAAGEFDPQRLAIATAASALMNRESGLTQKIAPNIVAPVPATKPPKSAEIIAKANAPEKSIANVATEIGTQTSPYALQGQINELTTAPRPPELPTPSLEQVGQTPAQLKQAMINDAVKKEGVTYQYAVFKPGEGKPSVTQVDVIAPDGSQSLVSSNVKDLNAAGAAIPEVPEWVPQGRYTRQEMEALIKEGKPVEIPPLPTADLRRASFEELDEWTSKLRNYDRALEESVLGKEGAERYRKAWRKANSSNDARAAEGSKEVTEIERGLTERQLDILYAKQGAVPYTDPESARDFVARVGDIEASETGADLARATSKVIQKFIQDTQFKRPIDEFTAATIARAVDKARSLGLSEEDFLRDILRYRMRFEGRDAPELLGMTERQAVELLRPKEIPPLAALPEPGVIDIPASTGAPTNAIPIQEPNAGVLRPETSQSELDVGLQGVVRENGPEGSPRNILREEPLQEPRTEVEQILASSPPFEPVAGRPQAATKLASRLRQQRGAVPTSVVAPLGGAAAGGTGGFTLTERRDDESEEAYAARRLRNTLLGAAAGAAGVRFVQSALQRGAADAIDAKVKPGKGVELPEGPIRRTAEKVVENKQYPERLRVALATDPDIIYDRFALKELDTLVRGASEDELKSMLASADKRARLGATAELANRYSLSDNPQLQDEGARLYSELAQQMTDPAQVLGIAKLVRTPQGFVAMVNERLKPVNRELSKPQEGQLRKLAADSIKTEQVLDRAETIAEQDFSIANEKAWRDAQKAHADAKKALDDYVHQVSPEGWGDILVKTVKGNLLTPLSLLKNPVGNIAFQPVMRGSRAISSAIDEIYSAVTKRGNVMSELNPIPSMAELKAAKEGIKVAAKELLTGPSQDSYIKGEVQRGFKPLRSLTQAFTGEGLAVRPDGTVAVNDRLKKLFEGTFGIPPEIMFRFLNMGDKPFRRMEEMRVLQAEGRLKGLAGRDLEKFIAFPDENARELLESEGRRAIFAQENRGVKEVNRFIDEGLPKLLHLDKSPILKEGLRILMRTQVPYIQFPINFLDTAANFALPEIGFARAIWNGGANRIAGGKPDRRKALTNLGEAVLGTMMYGAANWLWENGLISEPVDKDAKRRSVQYETMGPGRLNITGLNRALAGGNGDYRYGDKTAEWASLGIPAVVFHIFTSGANKAQTAAERKGETAPKGVTPATLSKSRIEAFPGVAKFALDQSFLAGTSAFLEALDDWDRFGDAWVQNTFRAASSIPVPNSVEALARAQYKYIPELRGDNLSESIKNVWDYKTFQLPEGDRAILKRDMWGDPIKRTPEGKNAYIHQFVDVARTEAKPPVGFKQNLLELFQQTDNPEVYPSLPNRNLDFNGVDVRLNPKDYELYQQYIGTYRKALAEKIATQPGFSNPKVPPEAKIMALQQAYSKGANAGKMSFIALPQVRQHYPELFGGKPPEGQQSRVVSRDLKSRLIQRQLEPAITP